MGKKKDANSAIGRSIIKDRQKKPGSRQSNSWHHTSDLDDGYNWNRINLNSVTEQNSLDEFLTTAELAGTEFTAEKLNISVITEQFTGLPTAEEEEAIQRVQEDNKDLLSIPRRPQWDSSTSATDLELKERESFLTWRRQLASLQQKDHVVLTPFERNLEFWRQLWRVLERSDVVVQIVDARNPLLFRCEDLEKYVKEVGENKENFILLSKADLLAPEQRNAWADYFTQQGIRVAFWSAISENERMKEELVEDNNVEEDTDDQVLATKSSQQEEKLLIETSNAFTQLEETVGNIQLEEDEVDVGDMETNTTDRNRTRDESAELDTDMNIHEMDERVHRTNSEQYLTGNHESDSIDENTIQDDSAGLDPYEKIQRTNNEQPLTVSLGDDIKGSKVKSDKDESNQSRCDYFKSEEASVSRNSSEDVSQNAPGLMRPSIVNSGKLVTGDELLAILQSVHSGPKATEGVTTVGMVGYPNVGKSSTINAVLQQKKVPVSATPGRTKHFQTLFVESDMCLCDCPGLVMPSFVSSKAEMVINGILPVDQLRDYISPVSLICQKVPRRILEKFYKIDIIKPREGEDPDRPPSALEFLNAYAFNRGLFTHKGVPNSRRVSLLVLKDFVNGRLLYRTPPPGVSDEEFVAVCEPLVKEGYEESRPSRPTITEEGTQQKHLTSDSVDTAFFHDANAAAHYKGLFGHQGLRKVDGHVVYPDHNGQKTTGGKPWKKHCNKNKKEKLRRTYKHLDVK